MDTIISLLEGQGIWCAVTMWLIYHQRKEHASLRTWVQDKVLEVITDNTKALTELKSEIRDKEDTHAHKNRR